MTSKHFIQQRIEEDIAKGGTLVTRFPPEPNGYLHIGHAKSICLNFGLAKQYAGGRCHLRFDDTNPLKEKQDYIDAIKEDVRWLGFDWGEHEYHSSDYFDHLYQAACTLIRSGKAYVCDLDAVSLRETRGTLTEQGRDSPYRDRSPEDNLERFAAMRAGHYDEGSCMLRAKINMASPNMNLRDPVLYRIRKATHPRTGDTWCIYPTYDFAHGLSDMMEGITHSLCTLEFEDHRPLYDWFLDALNTRHRPQQIEFSRLNLEHTITSKRKLQQLVEQGYVTGWDDPRMPTIAGLRRRGYSPESLRDFCARIGVSKSENTVEFSQLESCLRDHLNGVAPRAMAVLDPLRVVLTNYPEDAVEWLEAANHPQNPEMGSRQLPFGRELWIERDDFREQANKKYKRLVLGKEVRLRYGYVIRADEVIRSASGEITALHCSVDLDTLGRNPEGRKVKGVIHWLSCGHAIAAEMRLYDRLFHTAKPDMDKLEHSLNPASLHRCYGWLEAGLAELPAGDPVQFERVGYFTPDKDSRPETLVFNRSVSLRDGWTNNGTR